MVWCVVVLWLHTVLPWQRRAESCRFFSPLGLLRLSVSPLLASGGESGAAGVWVLQRNDALLSEMPSHCQTRQQVIITFLTVFINRKCILLFGVGDTCVQPFARYQNITKSLKTLIPIYNNLFKIAFHEEMHTSQSLKCQSSKIFLILFRKDHAQDKDLVQFVSG